MIDDIDSWRKANRIAAEVIDYSRSLIKKGSKLLDVTELLEKRIFSLGAKPAWPVQISCGSVAAHYTAEPDDVVVFTDQVVSVDLGVHLDGFIGDTALTVDLSGRSSALLKASEDALNNAINVLKPGVKTSEVGRIIQESIVKCGFSPVKNLTGHGINRFVIHDKPAIPNYDTNSSVVLEEDMIIAIEPFATDGFGMVEEAGGCNLFALIQKKPVRSPFAREILKFIEENYGPLPFATRWLANEFGLGKTNLALRELLKLGMLHDHPPLVEKNKGLVSVFEKTMLITRDGCEVLTKF